MKMMATARGAACGATLAVAAALMAACGGSAVATDPTAPDASSASGTADANQMDYVGNLARTVAYKEAGVTLAPPSGTDVAGVQADVAAQACVRGAFTCPAGHVAEVALARATVDKAGQIQPDGSLKPLARDELVYALTWNDVPCPPPVGPQGFTPPPAPKAGCTSVGLIDANTGTPLYGFDGLY
jgi:hypothetical protein